ncbi:MAG: hypothetical protein R2878_06765 [Thermoleophilia bacterium]
MNASRTYRRTGLGLAALAGSLAFAATGLGSSVTLVDPTPATGTQIQTAPAAARSRLPGLPTPPDAVTATPIARVNVTDDRDDVYVLRNPVTTPISGTVSLGVSSPVPATTTVTYSVSLWCINAVSGQPALEVFSETRTATLLAPDTRPRLMGTNRAYISGTLRYRKRNGAAARASIYTSHVLKVKPKCKIGPCTSVGVFSGLGGVLLKYAPAKKMWTGRLSPKQTTRLFTCRVGTRKYKNVTTGRLTIKLRQKSKGYTKVVGNQTRAMQLVGTVSGRITTSARGVSLGCPNGGNMTGSIRVSGQ